MLLMGEDGTTLKETRPIAASSNENPHVLLWDENGAFQS